MNDELAIKWAEALESEEFQQRTGSLHANQERIDDDNVMPEGYCCLGVLSCILPDELREKIRDVAKWEWRNNRWEYIGEMWSGQIPYESGSIPRQVASVIGLPHYQVQMFIRLNDEQHFTFPEIAEEIRNAIPSQTREETSASTSDA